MLHQPSISCVTVLQSSHANFGYKKPTRTKPKGWHLKVGEREIAKAKGWENSTKKEKERVGIFGPRKEEREGCQVLEGPEREKEITRKERKREGKVIKETKETFFLTFCMSFC